MATKEKTGLKGVSTQTGGSQGDRLQPVRAWPGNTAHSYAPHTPAFPLPAKTTLCSHHFLFLWGRALNEGD